MIVIFKFEFQVGYTIAGAFIFTHVESKHIMEVDYDVIRLRKLTVSKFWNMTMEMNPFIEHQYRDRITSELYVYQKRMVEYIIKGYDGSEYSYSAKWGFAGSFLYSLTVITTIGKSFHISHPHTHTHKHKINETFVHICDMV